MLSPKIQGARGDVRYCRTRKGYCRFRVLPGGAWQSFAEGDQPIGDPEDAKRQLVQAIQSADLQALPPEVLAQVVDLLKAAGALQDTSSAATAGAGVGMFSERRLPPLSPQRRRELLSCTDLGRSILRKQKITPLPIRQGGDS